MECAWQCEAVTIIIRPVRCLPQPATPRCRRRRLQYPTVVDPSVVDEALVAHGHHVDWVCALDERAHLARLCSQRDSRAVRLRFPTASQRGSMTSSQATSGRHNVPYVAHARRFDVRIGTELREPRREHARRAVDDARRGETGPPRFVV